MSEASVNEGDLMLRTALVGVAAAAALTATAAAPAQAVTIRSVSDPRGDVSVYGTHDPKHSVHSIDVSLLTMSKDSSRVYFKIRMKNVFKGTKHDYQSLLVRVYRNGKYYAALHTDSDPGYGGRTAFWYVSDQKTHWVRKSTISVKGNYMVVSVPRSTLKGKGKFSADADTDYIRVPKGSTTRWNESRDRTSRTGSFRLR